MSANRLSGLLLIATGAVICTLVYGLFDAEYFGWPAWSLLFLGVFCLWGGAMQIAHGSST